MKETEEETLTRVKEEVAKRNNFTDYTELCGWSEERNDLVDDIIKLYHSERLKIEAPTDDQILHLSNESGQQDWNDLQFKNLYVTGYFDGGIEVRDKFIKM